MHVVPQQTSPGNYSIYGNLCKCAATKAGGGVVVEGGEPPAPTVPAAESPGVRQTRGPGKELPCETPEPAERLVLISLPKVSETGAGSLQVAGVWPAVINEQTERQPLGLFVQIQ